MLTTLGLLAIMVLGMCLGWKMRGQKRLGYLIEHSFGPILCLLLFIFGVELGANPRAMKALPEMGVTALLLALGAILGSILFTKLIDYVLSKRERT